MSNAGDLGQFSLGDEFEDWIEHRTQDGNVQPRRVIGHVQTGTSCHERFSRDGGKGIYQGQPHFGPNLAGRIVNGAVWIPFVVILPLMDERVDQHHGGHPNGSGQERNQRTPKAKGVDYFLIVSLSQSDQWIGFVYSQLKRRRWKEGVIIGS